MVQMSVSYLARKGKAMEKDDVFETCETPQNDTLPSCPLCAGGRASWYLWIGLLIFIVIFIYANRTASKTETALASFQWGSNLQEAMPQAQQANRPILINFHARWCGACKIMDRQVFADAQVGKVLDNWIPVSVDVDRDPKTANTFGVHSLPTLVIISPDGQQLARREGTMSVEEFLSLIQAAESKLGLASTQTSQ